MCYQHLFKCTKILGNLFSFNLNVLRHRIVFKMPSFAEPLQFHSIHGEWIEISNNDCTATRQRGCNNGITFGSRPVKVNERITIRFLKTTPRFVGTINFGFTSINPLNFKGGLLPADSIPKFLDKPSFWIKMLEKEVCVPDIVFFFEVTPSGKLHYGINGSATRCCIYLGIDTRQPLWPIIDISGHVTSCQFVEIEDTFYTHRLTEEEQMNLALALSTMELNSVDTDTKVKDDIIEERRQYQINDCIICYDNKINSVLYKCGHMCMCIVCAKKLRKNKHLADAFCPICRAKIIDVIQTYQS